MSDRRRKEVAYEGKIRIVPFNPDELDRAEEALKDFVKVEDGEKLYVNPKKGQLRIMKLKKNRG